MDVRTGRRVMSSLGPYLACSHAEDLRTSWVRRVSAFKMLRRLFPGNWDHGASGLCWIARAQLRQQGRAGTRLKEKIVGLIKW